MCGWTISYQLYHTITIILYITLKINILLLLLLPKSALLLWITIAFETLSCFKLALMFMSFSKTESVRLHLCG